MFHHGPLTIYAKLRVALPPRMAGTFSPPVRVSDPDMHHGTCVTHVLWCMPGSLTTGFLWSRWRGKRSRQSWSMHNPLFCVSGKRPFGQRHTTGGLSRTNLPMLSYSSWNFNNMNSTFCHNMEISCTLSHSFLTYSRTNPHTHPCSHRRPLAHIPY